ncbi:hypothetical protein [Photorhabdus luminescens]|uniref:Uncharacterized protein n=1 Tax=Photorhabdus luminescens subsp. mexicana TaxID=2100167 RepID=A0A4R4IYB1_PHOLU|nr:hypothetical protein [Photorhabdus luminescens]TDB45319.1 hypothetical protein C5468_21315 [Photorhabdus luminescens subsp. mexicana]
MIQQDRITLKNLKVASFASQETWCFKASVYFDGIRVATASNEGHGGSTFIHAQPDMINKLAKAKAYAKSFPPYTCDFIDPQTNKPAVIEIDLEMVVDDLVSVMESRKTTLSKFNREYSKKVLFVKDGNLYNLPKTNLNAIRDKAELFSSLRQRGGSDIVIINELPKEKAFEVYCQHVIKD